MDCQDLQDLFSVSRINHYKDCGNAKESVSIRYAYDDKNSNWNYLLCMSQAWVSEDKFIIVRAPRWKQGWWLQDSIDCNATRIYHHICWINVQNERSSSAILGVTKKNP